MCARERQNEMVCYYKNHSQIVFFCLEKIKQYFDVACLDLLGKGGYEWVVPKSTTPLFPVHFEPTYRTRCKLDLQVTLTLQVCAS